MLRHNQEYSCLCGHSEIIQEKSEYEMQHEEDKREESAERMRGMQS